MKTLNQRNRRLILLGSVGIYALWFIPTIVNHFFWLILILAFVINLLFSKSLGNLYRESDEGLDERQLLAKYRIYRQSYRALIVLGIALLVGMVLLENPVAQWRLVAIFLMFVFGLPSYIAAWTEPDPILDEPRGMSAA